MFQVYFIETMATDATTVKLIKKNKKTIKNKQTIPLAKVLEG